MLSIRADYRRCGTVYPIAISIRSTNVYEEKSMGIFDEDIEEDERDAEGRFDKSQSATSYVAYHVRRQLSFDLVGRHFGL